VTIVLVAAGAAASAAVTRRHASTARGRRLWWLAALAAAVGVTCGATTAVPVAAGLAAVGLAAAAAVDLAELRVPARLAIGTAVASGGALMVEAGLASSWRLLVAAAVSTAVVVALFGLLWLAGGMGYGDVRLAAAAVPTAAAAGAGAGGGASAVTGVVALLWGAFVVAALTALVLAGSRRRSRAAELGRGPAVPAPAPAPDAAVPPARAPASALSAVSTRLAEAEAGSAPASRRPALAIPFGPALAAGWLLAVVVA
jgi:Flp pilus assembly protein protease CpaA